MKPYLILLLTLFLSLLQGAVLSLNLVLLVVLIWSIIRPPREAWTIAFFSGLFLDLAKGTPLGSSSLILLIVCFAWRLYSRRFDATQPLFLAAYLFLVSVIWDLILKEAWLIESLILAALSFLARPLVRFYHEDISRDRLRLKV